MNQSVIITTAANTQNSRTGRRFTQSQTVVSRTRSVSDVSVIRVPALLSARPIRTGTELVNGIEKTARVYEDQQVS